MKNSKVSFIKTENRSAGIEKVVDLLKINTITGKKTFLKPNFNSADPTPGSTHPDVLRALILKMKEMGAAQITIGDRSGMGDTRKAMQDMGIFKLAAELGVEIIVFDDLDEKDWVMQQPEGSHWKFGFPFARPLIETEAFVQTCCLKTHQFGGHFTLSLKNAVGMMAKTVPQNDHDFMKELHTSPNQRLMIAEINTAYTPDLVVMDGVEAFISGGPHQGEKVTPNAVFASTDRIAIDAVGVALLRMYGCKTEVAQGKIFDQQQIARAVELGLGIDSPERIEFITDDKDSQAYVEKIKAILVKG
ncbi:MAG: DUF362 domain-containing protein [Anaerolineaceae bacterium]|nr:DUF362 domain-containing protein [Anaerolineaceae bacterium]